MGSSPASCLRGIEFKFRFCYFDQSLCILLIPSKKPGWVKRTGYCLDGHGIYVLYQTVSATTQPAI
jgi:hypothetical protein